MDRRYPAGAGRFVGVVIALGLVLAMSATATAEAPFGRWHRDNYGAGNERLGCFEGPDLWACYYDNSVGDVTGVFTGRNVTDSWACPSWFPGSVCDTTVAVYRGLGTFVTSDGSSFDVSQEYVVVQLGDRPALYLHWVDQFVCPWYRSLGEASANDFNCTFAG